MTGRYRGVVGSNTLLEQALSAALKIPPGPLIPSFPVPGGQAYLKMRPIGKRREKIKFIKMLYNYIE